MNAALIIGSFIVFILASLAYASDVVNECGGVRRLSGRIGDLCETGIEGACPFGKMTCAGENSLQCMPDCNLTLNDLHASICITCKNNGTYLHAERRCSCKEGFTGERCEIEDVCAHRSCGTYGSCSQSEQRCVCQPKFTGVHCEVNIECVGEAFYWDGQTCHCTENFDGPACSRCKADLVCVPSNTTEGVFVAARIPNPELIDLLLTSPVPLGYSMKPYLPSAVGKRACSCTTLSSDDDLSASYVEIYDDGSGSTTVYIASVYRSQYERAANDDVAMSTALLSLVVGGALLAIIFMACLCLSFNSREPVIFKKKKKNSTALPE